MSKSEEIKVHIESKATHKGLEKSTTLNRRYVKRPTKLIITDGTENVSEEIIAQPERPIETPDLPPAPNPYQAAIDARKKEQKVITPRVVATPKELKDAAIAKALAEMEVNKSAEKAPKVATKKTTRKSLKKAEKREEKIAERVMLKEMKADKEAKKNYRKAEKETKHFKKRKGGRVLLALATSAACVIALAALVKINLPNISVKVAAVQTGVEASYPGYVPRDYNLTGVYTNNQTVIVEFSGPDDKKFALAEEKSSWDSNALLTNYVKAAYGDNYEILREQNITIYISSSNATWVKDGVFYRLTATAGSLNKKQIKNIATSL